ncbi:MAG: hypothetical protein AAAB20_01525 [Rhizobium sp.]|jgi:hypothetical protein|uniref:hypothetical protein n=1 Tax=unclassified Rhizobium TaxID=2613769 RepID=UPI00055D1A6E
MSNKQHSSHSPIAMDLTVVALVAFLAAMLYVFGSQMSGGTTRLTDSVHGAVVFDTRGTQD